MNILIVGVSGFIGRHIYDALIHKGHHVIGCSRREVANINWQKLDFNQSTEDWQQQLSNIDIVINAVGIYQQSASQSFSLVHDMGPKKLFAACEKLAVKVIQISAIGAEQEQPVTEFLRSKRNADQVLLESNVPNVVLYPGIVLGEEGRSTQQLSVLARLVCMPLVFGRNKALPMISIHQLTQRVVEIVQQWPTSKRAQVVVAKPETMETLLNNLRRWMGLGKGRFIAVPKSLINFMFWLFPALSVGAFNKQSVEMLSSYSKTEYVPVSDETASASLLKNKASARFNKEMQLRFLFYINLMVLSFIWIASGLVSLINFEQSREIIALMGVNGPFGDALIVVASIGDILLGVLLCVPTLRRWVIIIQISAIVIYSLIITIFVPLFWLHPFAPVIKNGAMVVLALYLLIEEKE